MSVYSYRVNHSNSVSILELHTAEEWHVVVVYKPHTMRFMINSPFLHPALELLLGKRVVRFELWIEVVCCNPLLHVAIDVEEAFKELFWRRFVTVMGALQTVALLSGIDITAQLCVFCNELEFVCIK